MYTRPLIHIGYHKTATTWMQHLLFVPIHGYCQIAKHVEVFDHIVKPHGLRFDPAPMQTLITRAKSGLTEGIVPVISSEILCGNPFNGGRENDMYATRLHAIAPEARILISIRKQQRILPSVYMQYLLRGGTMNYAQFFRGEADLGYFAFNPDHFKYDQLAKMYMELFGANNVMIVTQESLKSNMEATANDIASFCGNSAFENLAPSARRVHAASYPEYAVPVLRRINHLRSSQMNPAPIFSFGKNPKGLYQAAGYILKRPPIRTLFSSYRPVSSYVKEQFDGWYSDSNTKLSKLVSDVRGLPGYDGIRQPFSP